MSYTPGPWVQFVDRSSGAEVFTILPAGRAGEIATGILNSDDAHLLGAAPELLAMLKRIVAADDEFRASLPADWEGDPLTDECNLARDLIAKAEGR